MSTTWWLDFINGSSSNSGTSYASPKKLFSDLSPSNGDSINLMESGAPINSGVTGNWTQGSNIITLNSPLTTSLTGTGWTRQDTSYVYNASPPYFYSSGGSSGSQPLGYIPLSSSVDCSGYTTITFFIGSNQAIAAGDLQIGLCSDSAGATVVYSFNLPAVPSTNAINFSVTLNHGSAMTLATSINSIVLALAPGFSSTSGHILYVPLTVVATNGINYNSLVGTNSVTNTNDTWYSLINITPTQLVMGTIGKATVPYPLGSLSGASVYYRNTIQLPITTGVAAQNLTIGVVSVSGGWSALTGLQTSETWLDGTVGQGTGFAVTHLSGGAALTMDKFYQTRFNIGLDLSNAAIGARSYDGAPIADPPANISTLAANNCVAQGLILSTVNTANNSAYAVTVNSASGGQNNNGSLYIQGDGFIENIYNCHSNYGAGMYIDSYSSINVLGQINASYNSGYGINLNNVLSGRLGTVNVSNNYSEPGIKIQNLGKYIIDSLTASNNASGSGVLLAGTGSVTINSLVTYGNFEAISVNPSSGLEVEHYLMNANMSETTTVNFLNNTVPFYNQRVYSQNEIYPAAGYINKIYMDGLSSDHIISTTTGSITPGGINWAIYCGSGFRASYNPIKFKVPGLFFNAGTPVTFSYYVYASNGTIQCDNVILANSVEGISSDIVTSITSAADGAWAQYSISFTPTQLGVVDALFYIYDNTGATGYVRLADFSLTQT